LLQQYCSKGDRKEAPFYFNDSQGSTNISRAILPSVTLLHVHKSYCIKSDIKMGKGKLVFKGDKPKKKKKKSKHSSSSAQASNQDGSLVSIPASQTHSGINGTSLEQTPVSVQRCKEQPLKGPIIREGKGKITSSGTVLMGHGTSFSSHLNVGDAIVVQIESDEGSKEEMRVVTMRLSDASASISSAFSLDLKHPTNFQYIPKPKNIQKEKDEHEKKKRITKEEIERSAFGTYKSGDGETQELVYRERTEHGGYRIRREAIDGRNCTRSGLLDMRAQRKSDKYC